MRVYIWKGVLRGGGKGYRKGGYFSGFLPPSSLKAWPRVNSHIDLPYTDILDILKAAKIK